MPQQNRITNDGLARQMPMGLTAMSGPQGALVSDEANGEGRIAVVYDHGDPPPEITISRTAGNVQTVLANGVAVAIVACADGPDLAAEDVMLVERFRT
jgi:hypothetical protein